MSVDTTISRLRELALALPRPGCDWEERPHFDYPATLQSIIDFEHAAGSMLPADFHEFLRQTESIRAMSVHNGYWIGGINALISLMKSGDIPNCVNGESLIPIATDGGGNAFLLSSSGGVWRWDHKTGRFEVIATTFSAFLDRVADDWQAYISDKKDWQYLV